MLARAIAAVMIGLLTLCLFVATLPWDFEQESMSDWGYVVILASSFGMGLGFSTWRATEKSKIGLAGGILCLLAFVFWTYVAVQSVIHLGR